MKNHNQDNLEKAFALLESGMELEKVLMMFPDDKKALQEIQIILNSMQKTKEKVYAPKEILKKIFEENELSIQKPGRLSVFETLNNLINNLIIMNQKSKIIISILGIFVLLVVGVVVFNSNKNIPGEIVTNPKAKTIAKDVAITTTTAVIGDKQTDASINTTINDVLSDNDLDSEFADIDLALSDEGDIDQINNLYNDNEL